MATPPNPGSVLETMEKGGHKVQNAESVTLAGVESARNGKLPKRGVEGGLIIPLSDFPVPASDSQKEFPQPSR